MAARLSTVRCRELLAATCVELLKTALVGSAEGAAAATDAAEGSGNEQLSPETLLESLHATLQSSLQDAAHQIAPAHQEAWGEAQWEVFQEAHNAVHRLLLSLHSQAAEAGSAEGALQARKDRTRQRCSCGCCAPLPAAASLPRSTMTAVATSLLSTKYADHHLMPPPGCLPGCRWQGAWSTACWSRRTALRRSASTEWRLSWAVLRPACAAASTPLRARGLEVRCRAVLAPLLCRRLALC